MSFASNLSARYNKCGSLLCVGLDPRPENLEDQGDLTTSLIKFVTKIVEATKDYALLYKANVAFFECHGLQGYVALSSLRALIPADIPLLLDAKRCDIGATSAAYATALFDKLGADAITVNGYMGFDSVEPFITRADRGVFVLCKTSNPGSAEIQDQIITRRFGGIKVPIYVEMAYWANKWNGLDNVGLVVGATHPEQLTTIRKTCRSQWILSPGVGAQGGDLEATVRAGYLPGLGGIMINVSRGISNAENPREAAKMYSDAIRQVIADITDQLV